MACQCPEVDERLFKKMWENSDYVLVITPIERPYSGRIPREKIPIMEFGIDVLAKTEKVFKGNNISETSFIAQEWNSCDESFYFGEKYLVFGNEVRRFRKVTKKEIKKGINDGFNFDSREMLNDPSVFFEYKFYNGLAQKYTTLNTHSCYTFQISSSYFQNTVKKYLKDNAYFK